MTKERVKLENSPFVMIIRDGWGYNPNPDEDSFNSIKCADTPTDNMLTNEYPNCLIHTSGKDVGLPEGTMGNSEVGHQNIGAGRIVFQESVRITRAIRDGSFFEMPALLKAVGFVKKNNGKLHIMGLCSDIGVHSLLGHLYGLLELAKRHKLTKVFLHAFTDGRDSPPTSGAGYLAQIQEKMVQIGTGRIASIMGRFYAMDRDNRWERVQQAYDCMTTGKAKISPGVAKAMAASYEDDQTDEFVKPVNIAGDDGRPRAIIEDGDAVIFFNFRGDRPREISRAFVDDDFDGFTRTARPNIHFVCMTEYDKTISAPVVFTKPAKMKNILAEYISQKGLTQFRCAETEKYAHVTFFFNDYREEPFAGEDRQIVPSPKVRTYDLQPEMSAYEVCGIVLQKLDSNEYDVFMMNFANPDMVGHTGDLKAAIKAAEVVDECVGKILEKVKSLRGSAIILADHGNFEKMDDPEHHLPHTAHTIGDVPLIVFGEKFRGRKLADGGRLADVAPTFLEMMQLPQPEEMTGKSLFL